MTKVAIRTPFNRPHQLQPSIGTYPAWLSCSGQSLIEFSLLTGICFLVASVLTLVTWIYATDLLIEQACYRSLLCLSENRRVSDCKSLLNRRLDQLPMIQIDKTTLLRRRPYWQATVQWTLPPGLLKQKPTPFQRTYRMQRSQLESERRMRRWLF